jgi:hypothetical protein
MQTRRRQRTLGATRARHPIPHPRTERHTAERAGGNNTSTGDEGRTARELYPDRSAFQGTWRRNARVVSVNATSTTTAPTTPSSQ